ncbi:MULTISPECIES: ATP-binding protein [unclassified Caulobacter]|uniref:ATP-binding protein n=1 Tax=unclassified Caulobacter TaxID=2648921 RepID=UPI000D3A9965|nr:MULTISPECIES: ATP-binding protein [unclassified Caulobacter]PTS88238.1 hybrid sensor histidine kinase/response regulator [Caulobacter sp. HMWF009]PTT06990.1 hybrid sensor histidine kinase/response regulator [Caulobacter sp. HMWF025]
MSRSATFEAFRRIVTVVAGGGDLAGVLDAIVLAVEAELPRGICSILLLDETGHLLVHGSAPGLPSAYCDAVNGLPIGPQVGSCGTAIFDNRRVLVSDIQTDPLWADYRDLAAQFGLAACWSEPIRDAEHRAIGSFAIYSHEVREPSADDLVFIESAAELAGFAIERRRAQEALARSQALALELAERERAAAANLTTFFDVAAELMSIVDLKGHFVRVNKAWEDQLGYTAQELEGQPYRQFMHPEDLAPTQAQTEALLRNGAGRSVINRYRRSDGVYRLLEWRSVIAGELAFCVARDITEATQMTADLESARLAAETANLAKGNFLANMSHELRTPLNGVIGILSALDLTDLSPAQREMTGLMRASGVVLERLVSDIIDVSKVEAGQLDLVVSPFVPKVLFDDGLTTWAALARSKGLAFAVDLGAGTETAFEGDSLRLRQVIDSLLSNAIKFTTSGGVEVSVSIEPASAASDPAVLAVSVQDSGLGFDAATAERLFQRFDQADVSSTRAFGGAGIGLALSKSLVELMGGTISAQSEPGRGSLFRITVPLYPVGDGVAPVRDEVPVPEAALKVLLAEDNPTNQKVVQLILAGVDADLTIVENGAEAVQACEASSFDVVLMDLQMPVMDGLAAIRAIRLHEAESDAPHKMPIVVLSASAMLHHREEALAAGADFHIAKPVTASDLLVGISRALEGG